MNSLRVDPGHSITSTQPLPQKHSSLRGVGTSWWIACLGIVAGIMLSAAGQSVDGPAIAVLALAPLMATIDRRSFPGLVIGPISFMYIYHSLGYALGPLWQIHVIGHLQAIEDGFVPAQWGAVLGLATFALVFPVIFKWATRRFTPRNYSSDLRIDDARWQQYTIFLLVAVGFSVVYGFFSGVANRLGGLTGTLASSTVFSALNALHYPMFFFVGYLAARLGKGWRVISLVALLSYSVFYWLDGGRGASAFAAIFSAIGWVWGGASPRKVLLMSLIVLIPYIPLVGIVQNYRDTIIRDVGINIDSRLTNLLEAADNFTKEQSQSLAGSTQTFATAVTINFVDRIFLLTPNIIPYAGLEGIENLVYLYTPLIINPDRPNLEDGNNTAIKYGFVAPGSKGNYTPPVGDGYRRFGWPGIPLIYALIATIFGILLAITWIRRNRYEWLALFMFLTLEAGSVYLMTMFGSLSLVLWEVPRTFVTLLLVKWLGTALLRLLSGARYRER